MRFCGGGEKIIAKKVFVVRRRGRRKKKLSAGDFFFFPCLLHVCIREKGGEMKGGRRVEMKACPFGKEIMASETVFSCPPPRPSAGSGAGRGRAPL